MDSLGRRWNTLPRIAIVPGRTRAPVFSGSSWGIVAIKGRGARPAGGCTPKSSGSVVENSEEVVVSETSSQRPMRRRYLVAPAAFKGSLSADQAARAIAQGLAEADPSAVVDLLPLADGGEGTLAALLAAEGGDLCEATVRDPLGRPVVAHYALLSDASAVVETAEACGLLRLHPDELDPRRASTLGVGDLVRAALGRSPRRLLVGLGGSATVDGGAGMLQALGARLLDDRGKDLPPGGAALGRLASIELDGLDPSLRSVEIVGLCDVRSPLLGARGARLYMRQKGADLDTEEELEAGLRRLADVVRASLGVDLAAIEGAGAAGGLGFGLALLGGRLVSGVEWVLARSQADLRLEACDVVLGGEGRVDLQSLQGKAMLGLARRARAAGKPLLLFCGSPGDELDQLCAEGVTALFPLVRGATTEVEAMARAFELLREAARAVGRDIVGRHLV
jgi:glycerate kinase